ncbi:MAG TPA: ribosome maturation factor RimM [Acidobacteriota bacterium]|nr:ribosome maturation factor RimM [Acidobacteriota bacterium]
MIEMPTVSERIALGRIGKAHGIQGAFRVWPYADNRERFTLLRSITLTRGEKTLVTEVTSVHIAGRHIIIQTDAITTPDDVRPWLGGDLEIDASERIPPEPGRYYYDDVIGLRVETTAGETVGTITEIIDAPANDIYVCRDDDREYLIPAVDAFIKEYDIPGGRLVIDPIPGLLE